MKNTASSNHSPLCTPSNTESSTESKSTFHNVPSFIKDNIWSPIALYSQIYDVSRRALGDRYMQKHVAAHIVILAAVNFLLYTVEKEMGNKRREMMDTYSLLSHEDGTKVEEETWNTFLEYMFDYASSLFFISLIQMLTHVIDHRFAFRLRRSLTDALETLYYEDQNALALSHVKASRDIIASQDNAVSTIGFTGTEIFTSSVSTLLNSAFSIPLILQYSSSLKVKGYNTYIPDIPLYILCYALATQTVMSKLTLWHQSIKNLSHKDRVAHEQNIVQDQHNIKSITQSSGQKFIRTIRYEALLGLRSLVNKSEGMSLAINTWKSFANIITELTQYAILGDKIFKGTVPHAQRGAAFTSLTKLLDLITWTEKNASSISSLIVPLEQTNIFLNEIETIKNNPSAIRYSYAKEENCFEMKNLTLHSGDKDRSNVLLDNYSGIFHSRQRVLLKGESGTGKSSLTDIVNGITKGAVDGTGQIIYPKNQQKLVVIQDNYIGGEGSLLQKMCGYILLPKNEKALKKWKDRIYDFSKRVELNLPLWNDKEIGKKTEAENKTRFMEKICDKTMNWSSILSGGQTKKVKLIALYMQASLCRVNENKSPYFDGNIFRGGPYRLLTEEEMKASSPLILLDEAFVGINEKAVEKIQTSMMKAFPNAIILSIDHMGADEVGFYTNFLLLYDKKLLSFESKEDMKKFEQEIEKSVTQKGKPNSHKQKHVGFVNTLEDAEKSSLKTRTKGR